MTAAHSERAPAHAAADEPIALSVVVPAYNEALRIERSLRAAAQFLDARGDAWELVVADDGSQDGTAEAVRLLLQELPRIRLVQLDRNRGKGAALRAGVAASRGARVLLMDADLATPMEELDKLQAALDAGAQIAAGSRAVSQAAVTRSQSSARVLLGRAGNLWIRLLAVPGVHDTQCGFKLFDGPLARSLFAGCREDRFGIDIEVLCLARTRFGARIAEVGVEWAHQDGSKVRWHDYVNVLVGVPRIALSVARRAAAK